jgi:AbrB family looped-hinge helix DNA binding protein
VQELITLSSKGQVVIPKRIRDEAGLNAGDQLIVEWNGDHLELRKLIEKESKPNSNIVRELLGKYATNKVNSKEDETGADDSVRKLRETLYGKINNG